MISKKLPDAEPAIRMFAITNLQAEKRQDGYSFASARIV